MRRDTLTQPHRAAAGQEELIFIYLRILIELQISQHAHEVRTQH